LGASSTGAAKVPAMAEAARAREEKETIVTVGLLESGCATKEVDR
jgi:hypothetical protein